MQDRAPWLAIAEVVEQVRAGGLEPGAVAACHLARIERLNPGLGAYVHVDPAPTAGHGPLAGVTLAVKDTQPVAGMPWTYGSPRWRNRVATEDALCVRRAREAGMTVLGKTNTPELAASVGTANEVFPPTHNPWRRGFTPGGSSGGSGAAVAAGLCTVAFGDDMGGSMRIPSACCGVAGLRPSPRRVPVEVPDPTGLSVRGPIARSVADLRVAFATMASDPAPSPALPPATYRLAAVESSPVPVDPACWAACRRAAAALEAAGYRVSPSGWDPEAVARAYQIVRPASVSTMPGEPGEYGAAAGRLMARGRALMARDCLAALQAGLAAADALRRLVEDADAILTPTLGRLPMPIEQVPAFLDEEWIGYTQFVLPVSFAGLPAVSVPAGLHDGLPVGVQLVGRPGREWELLDLAERLEAAEGFGFQAPPSALDA